MTLSGIIGSDLKRRIVHIMARHIGQRLTPERKLLLGGAAAVVFAIPLALGITGCSARGGTPGGAEASNGLKTASIKLSDDTACCAIYTLSKDRFAAIEPAMGMIMFAYGEKSSLKPAQVLGGPDWMKTEVFHIDVELSKSLWDQLNPLRAAGLALVYPPDVRQADAVKQVFRSLLINRFRLRIKHETKDLPVYELVLAKNGPKIAEDKTADRSCRMTGLGPGKGLGMDVKSCDFSTFLEYLSIFPELRNQVLVDKTGLRGRYSFKLHWTPKMPPGMPQPAGDGKRGHIAAPPESPGPALYTALREQLGLKVVSGKAPVDVIVTEHIERPTPN